MILDIKRDDINSELLDKFISDDYKSDEKTLMRIADDYFDNKNREITERQKKMILYDENEQPYIKDDLSKANRKLRHSYLNELITQCTNYLSGKPLKIDYKVAFERAWNEDGIVTNDEVLQSDKDKERIDDELYRHNNFLTYMQENVDNVQLYGKTYLRIVADEHGYKFVTYDPKEIIMFYNDYDEPVLTIRYFTKNEIHNGEIIEVQYAEVFDSVFKDTWIKTKDKYERVIEDEPIYSKVTKYDDGIETTEVVDYHLYPIIEWKFNSDSRPTLVDIKDFIDMQDINLSDLANNVEDIQEAVWILENYHGQNLKEFMDDLKVKKAVKVGVGGNARTETIEIPIGAREKLYELCNKNIYKFGFGINFSERDNLGNVSGVALKWSYAPLEQKANMIENHAQSSLNQFFNILFNLMDMPYDSNDLEFIFDRSMIANEAEQTSTVMTASPQLSQKTILDNLPMVADSEAEIERLNEENDYNPTLPARDDGAGNSDEAESDIEDEDSTDISHNATDN